MPSPSPYAKKTSCHPWGVSTTRRKRSLVCPLQGRWKTCSQILRSRSSSGDRLRGEDTRTQEDGEGIVPRSAKGAPKTAKEMEGISGSAPVLVSELCDDICTRTCSRKPGHSSDLQVLHLQLESTTRSTPSLPSLVCVLVQHSSKLGSVARQATRMTSRSLRRAH